MQCNVDISKRCFLSRVSLQVLEVETVKLTPELRRRLPFLGHLPIHCDISFLEVDMIGLVSEETASKFREGTRCAFERASHDV